MAGRVEEVSDAIIALLDAADDAEEFNETLNAQRLYDIQNDLADVGEDVVSVVAPEITIRRRTSNGTYDRYVVVDILVLAHLTSVAGLVRATMDSRIELLEQVDNYLADPEQSDLVLPDGELAVYVEPSDKVADKDVLDGLGVLYDVGDLSYKRQVTGLVRVAYKIDETY